MPLLDETSRLDMLIKQFGGTDYTPPTAYKIAAVTTVPDDEDGGGLGEPADPLYSRIDIPNTPEEFGLAPSGAEIVNLKEWAFNQASVDWGTVFGLALYDNDDNYMGYMPFTTPKIVSVENILKVNSGSFLVTLDTTPLSVTIEEANVATILTAPNGNRYALGVSNTGTAVYTRIYAFGPPAPPTGLTMVGGAGGLLTWNLSPNDGGTPIISQTIWISDNDSKIVEYEVIDSEATSFQIEDYTGYVYVTADNIVGSSSPSNVINYYI